MTTERDIFPIAGPTHLTSINWKCKDYRRSVAASLVQGVYVLELDRQLNRQFPDAFAAPWWESFHFELISQLVDEVDSSIFGAVFEYHPPFQNNATQNAPRFVIAFRGTLTAQDLSLDLHLIQNGLHRTSRFSVARQHVQNLVTAFPNSVFWLAGHSLGAAMAMLAGKCMARTGVLMDAFLFNPPFVAAPLERIQDERVKHGLRLARSIFTAGLTHALTKRQEESPADDFFTRIASWVPDLFINPDDYICAEYIGYFDHRKNMEEFGIGFVERLATQTTISHLVSQAMGNDSDPLHLLPSANLTVNLSPSADFKSAHGLHQWWQPELNFQYKQYRYT